MALDYGLLGEDGEAQSRKNLKIVGCVVSAIAGWGMLFALIGGWNSNPVAPEVSGTALAAMPFTSATGIGSTQPRLGGLRATIFHNPAMQGPLAKLAISALDVNNRLNHRDISMKAAQKDLATGWDLVDGKTKDMILKTIEPIKYKSSVLAGITAPMDYFDPIGFSTPTTAGKLLFYREVELKHGRVAMLAALGILVGEQFHPLFGGNIDTPAIYAFQETPLQTFWPAVVAALAIPEVYSVFTFQDPAQGEQWAIREDHEPGNLGFDPLGLKPTDEKELIEMKTKELNNGRLAMIAVAGMVAQELVTGQKLF
jgi:hypothetical protein